MNKIEVTSLEKKFVKFEKPLKKLALRELILLKKNFAALEIYLSGDAKMLFLNKKYRGKNKIANVLSFPVSKNFIYLPNRFKNIGEIYLNIPYIKRESKGSKFIIHRSSFIIQKLLIHGILHLLGYTHATKNDRIKMEKKEKQLLKLSN